MGSLTDTELIEKVSRGDERAFRTLFDRYFTQLAVYADRLLGDVDSATDVVQSLFVSVYENRAELEVRNVRSFLYQSVHNRCLNELKHKKIEAKYAKQVVEAPADESENSVDELMDASELEAKVASLINALPAQCKRIFEMSRLEGISNADIAEQLGLSKRTVETQISKALKTLREALEGGVAVLILLGYV